MTGIQVNPLDGKRGIVTGASRGLGRSTALALAEAGAHVVAAARDRESLAETVELASGLPGRIVGVVADITREAEVKDLVSRCVHDLGGLDYIVNNAGTQVEKSLLETTNEDWDLVDSTNVRAAFWACKYAVEWMIEHGGGSIVNIASVLSVTADPMLPAYTASKHAVLGLTRSIAVTREYARAGVRANAVLPGDMETPMVTKYFASHDDPEAARRQVASSYPMERISDPMEVARVVRFLVSSDSSFVNGSAITVDGGILASLYTSA
ncbi:SDR family oxidoreductase [Pseudarthrobacter sp. R1]|uniref:SDR family NAD(P)-dependent oxidoreductase n=1 Tax=Pseudarthrobacter sp. R1 TaxID=2944934 RepID=UPI00210CA528|nr:SDR family oxidoreductase [Pseudarthrobacter sp. R1]MCQ6272780.1 SDR family oxidoreductase [Pseudarthrobacter sp. R1]